MKTLPTDKAWRFYGREAPYFGVFGQEEYLNCNLDGEKSDNFFLSGEEYVKNLFETIHKKIDPDFKPGTILDFGCGPGRMVIPFSRYAGEITGMDISMEMLDEAKRNCVSRNISNARFLISDDDLNLLDNQMFDLVHTFIVLQHLNPGRGELLFKSLIEKIKPEGIGVFHFTYLDHYPGRKIINFFRFRMPYLSKSLRIFRKDTIRKNLKSRPQMQMNNYKLNRVFKILQEKGVKQVLSDFTDHHQYWGVNIYFMMP